MFGMFENMRKNEEEGKVDLIKKNKRRALSEFATHFYCPHKGCKKFYGV